MRNIITIILCIYASALNAQFTINGIEPFLDTYTNSFLLSIEKNHYNQIFNADISKGTEWKEITINGIEADKGPFTFENIRNNTYHITANSNVSYSLQFTYLHIIAYPTLEEF